VDYPIPGNDDAIRSVATLTRVVADAVAEGLIARAAATSDEKPEPGALGSDEPLADWERELLQGENAPAAAPASTASEATASEATATPEAAAADAAPAAEAPAADAAPAAEAPAAEAPAADAAAEPPPATPGS
jgi:small subunit ribosomal protein S2